MKYWGIFICILFVTPILQGAWYFAELNWSPGQPYTDDSIDDLAWRPQGDYALIPSSDALLRLDFPSGDLSYQSYTGENLDYIEWAPDGSYALLTGYTHLYRYDHAEEGFGTLTEITSIQKNDPDDEVIFYEIVFDPTGSDESGFITSNYEINSSGQHQIRIYRYDPSHSPQAWIDYSGGTTYAMSSAFGPLDAAMQADGDYFVISNQYGYFTEGFYIYDHDQSTFPKETSGAMVFIQRTGHVGNANGIAMSTAPGVGVGLLMGNGTAQRFYQTGLPPSMVIEEAGGITFPLTIGDASFCTGGHVALAVERNETTPAHRLGLYNEVGVAINPGVTIDSATRPIRFLCIEWHPYAPFGLLAGQERWIYSFATDELPIPTITPTPTSTTPTPSQPVPVTGFSGLSIALILLSCIMIAGRQR